MAVVSFAEGYVPVLLPDAPVLTPIPQNLSVTANLWCGPDTLSNQVLLRS
jgi:hypothetical protein